jgi:hypothetical protein
LDAALRRAHLLHFSAGTQASFREGDRGRWFEWFLERTLPKLYPHFVVATFYRLLFVAALSWSIVSITLPAKGAPPPKDEMSCCATKSSDGSNHDEDNQPGHGQDRQCCPACAIALALFLAPSTPGLFPPNGGEIFSTISADLASRLDQPPVPPPRA